LGLQLGLHAGGMEVPPLQVRSVIACVNVRMHPPPLPVLN
jgi:hypothetical protein